MVQMWKTLKAKCHGRYNNGIFDSFYVITLGLFSVIECGSHGNILDILKDSDIEISE